MFIWKFEKKRHVVIYGGSSGSYWVPTNLSDADWPHSVAKAQGAAALSINQIKSIKLINSKNPSWAVVTIADRLAPFPPSRVKIYPKGVTSAHHFPHVQPSMWHKYVGSSLLSLVPTHIYVYVSNKTMTTREKADTGEIIKYKFFFSVLYGLSVWFK